MNPLLAIADGGETLRRQFSPAPQVEIFSTNPGRPPRSQERRKVEQTIRYMVEHLAERLNIKTLAALVHVCPSAYFAMFKRHTGFAPIECFIHLRMYRACVLLDQTDLAVKEVASAVGYEDAFYFSRLFKSISYVAPTSYRYLPAGMRKAIWKTMLPEACSPMLAALCESAPAAGFEAMVGPSR